MFFDQLIHRFLGDVLTYKYCGSTPLAMLCDKDTPLLCDKVVGGIHWRVLAIVIETAKKYYDLMVYCIQTYGYFTQHLYPSSPVSCKCKMG